MLDRPIPDFDRLLAAAQRRRRGRPAGLERVIERLEVAVDVAEKARQRRERMRRDRVRR